MRFHGLSKPRIESLRKNLNSEAYMSLAENGAAMRITAWLTKETTERNTLHLQSAVKKQIQYGNREAA